jgi:hypothetical protein
MLLGCSREDTHEVHSRLEYFPNTIWSPFTIIKAFLELERERRFDDVDDKVCAFEEIIYNYGQQPGKETRSRPRRLLDRASRAMRGKRGSAATHKVKTGGKAEDPKELISLYLEVCHLKNALMAWRAQLSGFAKLARVDFRPPAGEQDDIDAEEYLQRMGEEYDIKINKCEMVLQGASLTFQMVRMVPTCHFVQTSTSLSLLTNRHPQQETAHLSRLDTGIALRDGKQMKAIAVLTMIFLPGTFIAVSV